MTYLPRVLVTICLGVVYAGTIHVCIRTGVDGHGVLACQMLTLATALPVAIGREYRHKAHALLLSPTDAHHDRCARVAPAPAPASAGRPERPAPHGDADKSRVPVTLLYLVLYVAAIYLGLVAYVDKSGPGAFQMVAVAAALLVAIAREYRHKACLLLLTPAAPDLVEDPNRAR